MPVIVMVVFVQHCCNRSLLSVVSSGQAVFRYGRVIYMLLPITSQQIRRRLQNLQYAIRCTLVVDHRCRIPAINTFFENGRFHYLTSASRVLALPLDW